VRIIENGLFKRSGKADFRVKWLKNFFRFFMVFLCSVISWLGAADLDKFVALVGSFACVPLCYIYPAMLHYRACARTRTQKAADIVMVIFGVVAAWFTTWQTIRVRCMRASITVVLTPFLQLMIAPDKSGPPKYGHCDPPAN
jgi:proton-coupled amino acid transporter